MVSLTLPTSHCGHVDVAISYDNKSTGARHCAMGDRRGSSSPAISNFNGVYANADVSLRLGNRPALLTRLGESGNLGRERSGVAALSEQLVVRSILCGEIPQTFL